MYLFLDIFCGEEVLSDTFKLEYPEEFGGQIIKVVGKSTSISTAVDDSMIGGNKSAEADGSEDADGEASEHGVDCLLYTKMKNEQFFASKKKDFAPYIKDKMKAVAAKMEENGKSEEDITAFKKGMQAFIKFVMENFADFQYFLNTGDDNLDGMVVFCRWEETDANCYYIKESLLKEKC